MKYYSTIQTPKIKIDLFVKHVYYVPFVVIY